MGTTQNPSLETPKKTNVFGSFIKNQGQMTSQPNNSLQQGLKSTAFGTNNSQQGQAVA